jgi:stearoyl-CoA desaturase (delta-9 desaturase)
MNDSSAELVPPHLGRVVFCWKKAAWFYAMLVPALVWAPDAFSAPSIAVSGGLAFLTLCLGHSVGLHRGIIHQAYSAPPVVRRVLAYLFVHAGLGGPISWIRLHYQRDHWQGQPASPRYFRYDHGIVCDFWWNLHCVFVPTDRARYGVPLSDENDPWLVWLERTWPLHVIGLFLLLALLGGWGFAVVCVCGRVAAGIFGHWFVGFLSHTTGYRRYAIGGATEEGNNVLVLGVLSFGEGFHNNHHANPRSARMGEAFYEIDVGWWVVCALEALGLVHDVNAWSRPTPVRKDGARPIGFSWRLR